MTDVKKFSELIDSSKGSEATTHNNAQVDIDSNASDSEAWGTALLQNEALALTDPYLAKDGTYTLAGYPSRIDATKWKVCFTKEGDEWMYWYWAHPTVHEQFIKEIEIAHYNYGEWLDKGKPGEWLGHELRLPPYIALSMQFETGLDPATDEFKTYVANNAPYYFVDKDSLDEYRTVAY